MGRYSQGQVITILTRRHTETGYWEINNRGSISIRRTVQRKILQLTESFSWRVRKSEGRVLQRSCLRMNMNIDEGNL